MIDLTSLANEIHEQNVKVGWWDDWPVKSDRYPTAMILVVSELSEALEGDRKGLMDDHLPEFKCFDVELADAMIRLLDLAGAYKMGISNAQQSVSVDRMITRMQNRDTVPEQLYEVAHQLFRSFIVRENIFSGITSVIAIAELNNVDLWKLVALKRAYNKKRLDHKRENRVKKDGKKY